MNILVLNGSPRKNGNTAKLTEAFSKGATEAGHSVKIIDVAMKNIGGCKACEYCHTKGNGTCALKDDMQEVYPELLKADMLVLASPIYYFTLTAQLQAALHRTYALGSLPNIKKAALIMSSGSPEVYDASIKQYQEVIDWWGAENMGVFAIPGEVKSHDLDNTSSECLTQLYQCGRTLTK